MAERRRMERPVEGLREQLEEGLLFFGIDFDESTLVLMCRYVEEIEKWNRNINLVGLKDTGRIVSELIYDAFFLFTHLGERERLCDLGSGSGALAIPIAILDSGRTVFTVDKSLKKCQFQRHVRRMLGLWNLTVHHGRIEDLESLDCDVLMAKAFGSVRDVIAKGGRHVREGGLILLPRGKGDNPSEEEGFRLLQKVPYTLPKGDKGYQLFVYKKVSQGPFLW